MDLQYFIVIVIILGAIIFAAKTLVQKSRAFSPKPSCGDDCGCGKG
ncbi:MAG: FeoB-associated Cys-rich membrane protein [Chloracidobacterium sp.]|nr:FeoB-associated Cys-rich membrane protein [Chloracidobacterium sp.]MCC7307058.1 FeoB-associated Cys-rich membrane protein [Acidobacteriota bacterium]